MKKTFHNRYKGIGKQPWLVAGRTQKMARHYVRSTLCVALATTVDSLVAGWQIGSDALAAISAVAPLLAIGQILHCLLAFGIEKIMIQHIGRGERREANRVFGTVLIAIFAVHLIVFIPVIIFERPILSLFITDPALVDLAIIYSVPILIFSPLFEVFLCIERAFRIDGRAALLSSRAIVMNLCNILLDYLLVSVFGMGISGLAWASVIGSAIGYCLPLSHFFSKKRTVSPDLSVIWAPREMAGYLKRDIIMGSSATLEELLETRVITTQTAVISGLGGVSGLAIFAIYKTLKGVIIAISNGIAASVSVHTGLLFGTQNYTSVKNSVKTGIGYATAVCVTFVAGIMIFAEPLGSAFNIDPSSLSLFSQCIRFGSAAFPGLMLSVIMGAYLPAVGKNLLANILVFIQKGLMFLATAAGFIQSQVWFYRLYTGAALLTGVVIVILLIHNKNWFMPKDIPDMIGEFSLRLLPEYFPEVSKSMYSLLKEFAYGETLASRTALVAEETLSYIRKQNPDREVAADIELKQCEQGAALRILDDGITYNPINDWAEVIRPDPEHFENIIIMDLTAEVKYDRVLDLNNLVLIINDPQSISL